MSNVHMLETLQKFNLPLGPPPSIRPTIYERKPSRSRLLSICHREGA